jgi:hypothetical protein
MSLEHIRDLFYLAVIAVAIILDCTGGIIGWTAAVVILAGARPVFQVITCAASDQGADEALSVVEHRLVHRDR